MIWTHALAVLLFCFLFLWLLSVSVNLFSYNTVQPDTIGSKIIGPQLPGEREGV